MRSLTALMVSTTGMTHTTYPTIGQKHSTLNRRHRAIVARKPATRTPETTTACVRLSIVKRMARWRGLAYGARDFCARVGGIMSPEGVGPYLVLCISLSAFPLGFTYPTSHVHFPFLYTSRVWLSAAPFVGRHGGHGRRCTREWE